MHLTLFQPVLKKSSEHIINGQKYIVSCCPKKIKEINMTINQALFYKALSQKDYDTLSEYIKQAEETLQAGKEDDITEAVFALIDAIKLSADEGNSEAIKLYNIISGGNA
jgi:hypothetical protein